MEWQVEVTELLARASDRYADDPEALRQPLARAVRDVLERFTPELLKLQLQARPWGYKRTVLGTTPRGCELLVVEVIGRTMIPHNHCSKRQDGSPILWSCITPVSPTVVENQFWERENGSASPDGSLAKIRHETLHPGTPAFYIEGRLGPIHRLVTAETGRTLHIYSADTDDSEFFSGWLLKGDGDPTRLHENDV